MTQGANDEEDVAYRLIGEFIFWFSQLEISLRIALSEALRLPQELFDPVTASYDFRTLCDVTLAACKFRCPDETTQKEMSEVVNEAKAVNDLRIKIVHGSWAPSPDGLNAFHMSRQSLVTKFYFNKQSELEDAVARCQKAAQRSVGFPGTSLGVLRAPNSKPVETND